jgi:uncharacterized protein YukE
MSASKESVCQRFAEFRKRLNRLQESWEGSGTGQQSSGWNSFSREWQDRWTRIVGMLREIENVLSHSRPTRAWDNTRPAILPFPPMEDGVISMGPF